MICDWCGNKMVKLGTFPGSIAGKEVRFVCPRPCGHERTEPKP